MELKGLIITATLINLFNASTGYVSNVVFRNVFRDNFKLQNSSPMYTAIFTFVFGIAFTSIIIASGLGDFKDKKIDDIIEKV